MSLPCILLPRLLRPRYCVLPATNCCAVSKVFALYINCKLASKVLLPFISSLSCTMLAMQRYSFARSDESSLNCAIHAQLSNISSVLLACSAAMAFSSPTRKSAQTLLASAHKPISMVTGKSSATSNCNNSANNAADSCLLKSCRRSA